MRIFTLSNEIVKEQTLRGNNIEVQDPDRVRIFSITKDKFRLIDEHNPSKVILGNKIDINDLIKDLDIKPCDINYKEIYDLGFKPNSLIDVWFHNFKRLLGVDDLNKYFVDITYDNLYLTIKVKEAHNFLKGEVKFKVCDKEPETLKIDRPSAIAVRRERTGCTI